MATIKYNLAVKTGSYTNGQGEQKNRYENIGSVFQGDNGPFVILKRTFNPAGVPNPENKDSIIVSCFEPRDNGAQNQSNAPQQQQSSAQAPQDFSQDVPF